MVQLSAFNTPQFEWGRTTLKKRPRPMGKIYQPEVAARAVYHAALHPRRELWVGWPAVQSILGTRIIPGLLDRYLANTAVTGQHTDEPLPADRPALPPGARRPRPSRPLRRRCARLEPPTLAHDASGHARRHGLHSPRAGRCDAASARCLTRPEERISQ